MTEVMELSTYPELGRARDDLGEGWRMLVENRYLIYYRTTETGIEFLRVIDGRRDQRRALGQMR